MKSKNLWWLSTIIRQKQIVIVCAALQWGGNGDGYFLNEILSYYYDIYRYIDIYTHRKYKLAKTKKCLLLNSLTGVRIKTYFFKVFQDMMTSNNICRCNSKISTGCINCRLNINNHLWYDFRNLSIFRNETNRIQ